MKRELTWKERQYISRMSARSPMQAIELSKLLEENSYRKNGKTYFFQTPKIKDKNMKVLTKNIVVFFYCKNHKSEKCQINLDVILDEEYTESLICPICKERLTFEKECLVTN